MRLSLVIPVFNEEEALPALLAALGPVLADLGCDHEIVFIDDGSKDGTRRLLEGAAAADPRVKVLGFSRNFGHQAAITAGLDFATGDAVVVMDADLQDPPELLPEMVARFEQGFDVVSAQRVGREGEGLFKRGTAALFYGLMRRAVDERLVPQVGDFRLFSRAAVEALRGFREQHRFLRGLVAWLGLKEAIIPFHRPARVAGTTKYPTWKMVCFAWTAISSFSALPLKLALFGGLLLTVLGALYSLHVVYEALFLDTAVRGWSTLVCLQLLFSGATLSALGLIGSYVARIYEEAKGRPLYVVSEALNLGRRGTAPARAVCLPRPVDVPTSAHEQPSKLKGDADAAFRDAQEKAGGHPHPGGGVVHGLHAQRLRPGRAALPRREPDRRAGAADAGAAPRCAQGAEDHRRTDEADRCGHPETSGRHAAGEGRRTGRPHGADGAEAPRGVPGLAPPA
jgi:dolichol-phosphate mannosyltransferase